MQNLKSKMERIEALKSGESIQHTLNEAFEILGNPVLTHDMEYKVIACTQGIVTDDPIWNEYDKAGAASSQMLEFFKNECFLDTAANTPKMTFLRSPKLQYDRIFGKLFNRDGIQIGCAVIMESHRPFDGDDPVLFELLCDVLNHVISKSEFFAAYGQEYQESLINALIKGEIKDKETYTAHVESIYMNLKEYLYLAAVDSSQCDPEHKALALLRDRLKRAKPEFRYSVYEQYVAVIISADSEQLNVREDLGELSGLIGKNSLRMGISGSFDNLFELDKYYRQAVKALSGAPQEKIGNGIFLYDGD